MHRFVFSQRLEGTHVQISTALSMHNNFFENLPRKFQPLWLPCLWSSFLQQSKNALEPSLTTIWKLPLCRKLRATTKFTPFAYLLSAIMIMCCLFINIRKQLFHMSLFSSCFVKRDHYVQKKFLSKTLVNIQILLPI